MRWTTLAKTAGAAAVAALLVAGCTGGEDAPAATDGATDASAEATTDEVIEPAPPEPAATVSYVGSWVQTDDPNPSFLTLQEGGRVTHNEDTLPDGSWETTPQGGVVITFTGQQSVRITGAMEGETLVLTLPDGETGRFMRSSAAAAPSRGSGQANAGGFSQNPGGQQPGGFGQQNQGGGSGFGQGY